MRRRDDFGFWILDFGFWILDFGFWIDLLSSFRGAQSTLLNLVVVLARASRGLKRRFQIVILNFEF
jgi:hypothetical protein